MGRAKRASTRSASWFRRSISRNKCQGTPLYVRREAVLPDVAAEDSRNLAVDHQRANPRRFSRAGRVATRRCGRAVKNGPAEVGGVP